MTAPALYYRVRIRDAADAADLLSASSVKGGPAPYGYHPYIERAPHGDGQEVDILTGDVSVGTYVAEIIDWWAEFTASLGGGGDDMMLPDDWCAWFDGDGDVDDDTNAGCTANIALPAWNIFCTEHSPGEGIYRPSFDSTALRVLANNFIPLGSGNGYVFGSWHGTGTPGAQATFSCDVEISQGTLSGSQSGVRISETERDGTTPNGGLGYHYVIGAGPEAVSITFTVPASGEFWIAFGRFDMQYAGGSFELRYTNIDLQLAGGGGGGGGGSQTYDGRIWTAPLNDATLRAQYLGHRAYLEESADGTTWNVLLKGYVTRTGLDDALKAVIEVGDTDRVEQQADLFVPVFENGTPEVLVGRPSCLLGGPVQGGFDPLIDLGKPLFRVKSVVAGEFVEFEYVSGPLPLAANFSGSWYALTGKKLATGYSDNETYLNGVAVAFAVPSSQYQSSSRSHVFPTIRVEVTSGGGTLHGIFSCISRQFSYPFANALFSRYFGVLADANLFGSNLSFAVNWSTNQPSVGAQFNILMQALECTERTPYHMIGHPVQLAKQIYDALDIPYDATSVTDTENALGPQLLVLQRPRQPENAADVLSKWLYGPFGFAYRVTSTGIREFYATRYRDNSPPATVLTLADLRAEDAPYQIAERNICNVVRWKEESFWPWELTTDYPVDQRPLDGLLFSSISSEFVAEADIAQTGTRREHVYEYPGHVHDSRGFAGFFVPSARSYQQAISEEITYRFGRGGPEIVFPVHRDGIVAVVGEYLINAVNYSPIPMPDGQSPITFRPKDQPARNGRQVVQIIKRTITPEGPDLQLAIIGPVSADFTALPVPTVTIAAEIAPYDHNMAVVTVTNQATILADATRRIEVYYGTGATTPSGWVLMATLYPTDTTGPRSTPFVAAGSVVWARARVVTTTGLVGAYSTPVSVDLADLVAPSGLSHVQLSSNVFEFTWTNGEPLIGIVLEFKRSTDTVWTRYSYYPAGTTSAIVAFPLTNTTYDVRVYHEQSAPLIGTSAAATDQITTGATAATLAAPTNPVASSGSGTVTLCVVTGDDLATVVFERAQETAPGAGTYGSFTVWAILPGGPIGTTICAFFTSPNDGLRWQVRAKHSLAGFTDSPYTTVLTVDPWVTVTPSTPLTAPYWIHTADPSLPNALLLDELDDIPDVNAPAPNDGEVLTWDATPGEWVAAPGAGGLDLEDEGTPLGAFDTIDFVGAGVTVVDDGGGHATATIPAAPNTVTVEDEGSSLGAASILDFVGAGVTASFAAGQATVTIPGAGPAAAWAESIADIIPASPTAQDDEFEATTLDAKWTVVTNTVAAVDFHTTWPSHLYTKFTGNAEYTIKQAYVPGAGVAFSLTACARFPVDSSVQIAGLRVREADDSDWVDIARKASGGNNGVTASRNDAGTPAFDFLSTFFAAPQFSKVYLHMQRTTADVWTFWWSSDGLAYYYIGTHTKALTVQEILLYVYQDTAAKSFRAGWHWVRRDWVTL